MDLAFTEYVSHPSSILLSSPLPPPPPPPPPHSTHTITHIPDISHLAERSPFALLTLVGVRSSQGLGRSELLQRSCHAGAAQQL